MSKNIHPIFTSAYSFKSLLKIKELKKDEHGVSIYNIAKEYGLKKVILLEENMVSFMEAKKSLDKDFQLIYGLRMDLIFNEEYSSKICVFALNSDGYTDIMKLYSTSQLKKDNKGLTEEELRKGLTPNLLLAVPFYDSFIHKNMCSFANIIFPMDLKPVFFTESNKLFIDKRLGNVVREVAAANGCEVHAAKSIFYKSREDFDAYVTYRCVTSRKFSLTKSTLANPNLEGMASNLFCIESWKEEVSK